MNSFLSWWFNVIVEIYPWMEIKVFTICSKESVENWRVNTQQHNAYFPHLSQISIRVKNNPLLKLLRHWQLGFISHLFGKYMTLSHRSLRYWNCTSPFTCFWICDSLSNFGLYSYNVAIFFIFFVEYISKSKANLTYDLPLEFERFCIIWVLVFYCINIFIF